MKVFISCSGERSERIALLLHEWLPRIFPEIKPWVYHRDISKGKRWNEELASALSGSGAGILCMTPESLGSLWMAYEAGALANLGRPIPICPYLVGLESDALENSPYEQFQASRANRDETLFLLRGLNELLAERGKSLAKLEEEFGFHWPVLHLGLARIAPEWVELPTAVAFGRTAMDLLRPVVKGLEDRLVDHDARQAASSLTDRLRLRVSRALKKPEPPSEPAPRVLEEISPAHSRADGEPTPER